MTDRDLFLNFFKVQIFSLKFIKKTDEILYLQIKEPLCQQIYLKLMKYILFKTKTICVMHL